MLNLALSKLMLTLKIFGAKKKEKKDITVQRWYCSGHIELNIKALRGRCYGLDIVDCSGFNVMH